MSAVKILALDDDEEFLSLVDYWMDRFGAECDSVTNPAKAVGMAQANDYDLVWIDEDDTSRFAESVVERIKSRKPNQNFAVVTSSGLGEFLNDSHIRVLDKPVTVDQIKHVVGDFAGGGDKNNVLRRTWSVLAGVASACFRNAS